MSWFSRKKTRHRRRSFLIDTNQSIRSSNRKFKSRFFAFLLQFRFLKNIPQIFQFSVLKTIIIVFMVSFIAFSFFSPYFDIQKISFTRDNPSLNIEKMETIVEPYYGTNMLLFQSRELESLLLSEFSELRTVTIKEKWPSELEIQMVMSPPFVNIFNEETANFWVVSEDGIILQMGADESLPTIAIRQYTKPIRIGEPFIEQSVLESFFLVQEFLQQELNLPIQSIIYFLISREVHFITESNIALWIDVSQDVLPQIQKLKLADERIGLYSDSFEYIDLRIPDQIFYKKQ